MLYDALPDRQKLLLAVNERELRAFHRGLSKLIVQARAINAAIGASGGMKDILASIDTGQVIPTDTGAQGTQDLTKDEWDVIIAAGIETFLTTYDTPAVRAVLAKSGGPTAGL